MKIEIQRPSAPSPGGKGFNNILIKHSFITCPPDHFLSERFNTQERYLFFNDQ